MRHSLSHSLLSVFRPSLPGVVCTWRIPAKDSQSQDFQVFSIIPHWGRSRSSVRYIMDFSSQPISLVIVLGQAPRLVSYVCVSLWWYRESGIAKSSANRFAKRHVLTTSLYETTWYAFVKVILCTCSSKQSAALFLSLCLFLLFQQQQQHFHRTVAPSSIWMYTWTTGFCDYTHRQDVSLHTTSVVNKNDVVVGVWHCSAAVGVDIVVVVAVDSFSLSSHCIFLRKLIPAVVVVGVLSTLSISFFHAFTSFWYFDIAW